MTQGYSETGSLFTDVALETFRLGGILAAEGDRLTADLGLSSARWKVLGALDLEARPLTVAQVARRMGLARQSVQRVVADLERGGYLELLPNPDHQRSPLAHRTPKGEEAYAEAMRRHVEWANRITEGMEPSDLARAATVLAGLAERLEVSPWQP